MSTALAVCTAVAGCTSKHTPGTAETSAAAHFSSAGSSSAGSVTTSAAASTSASATPGTSVGTIKPIPSFTFNLTDSAAAPPADHDVPIGQTLADKEDGGTLTWRVNGIRFATKSADGVERPSNARFAVVDVTVSASGGPMDVDPASLTLQTSDDQEWTSYFTGSLFPPALKARRLSSGQSVRGNITFDISNARVLRIALYTQSSATMGWRVS